MTSDSDLLTCWYMTSVQPQHAQYNLRMADIAPYRNSPRWERERMAAEREFNENTFEARELYEIASEELETLGELTDDTSYALAQFKVGEIMRDVA